MAGPNRFILGFSLTLFLLGCLIGLGSMLA